MAVPRPADVLSESAAPSPAARGRIFYGWWVAAALAVAVFLSTGVRFAVGPFLKPIVADQAGGAIGSWLGGALFELTGGYGLAFTVAGVQLVAGALVSFAIDERARCGPRWSPVPAAR